MNWIYHRRSQCQTRFIIAKYCLFILRIKKALCSVEYKSVEKVVQEAMNLKTAQEIEEYIIEKILIKHP